MTKSRLSVMFGCALITATALVGGLLLGVASGDLVFNALPGHTFVSPALAHIVLAAAPALTAMLAGAALWGLSLGSIAGVADQWRMGLAGAAGFAPITIAVGIVLSLLEPVAVEKLGTRLPVHRLLTLLFVPASGLVAGVGAGAIGLGLRDRAIAWNMGWRASLAAALSFLVVNLALDGLGWRVGAPGAASRFTMLTVLFVSSLGAALAAGAAIGHQLGGLAPSRVPRNV